MQKLIGILIKKETKMATQQNFRRGVKSNSMKFCAGDMPVDCNAGGTHLIHYLVLTDVSKEQLVMKNGATDFSHLLMYTSAV